MRAGRRGERAGAASLGAYARALSGNYLYGNTEQTIFSAPAGVSQNESLAPVRVDTRFLIGLARVIDRRSGQRLSLNCTAAELLCSSAINAVPSPTQHTKPKSNDESPANDSAATMRQETNR